MYFLLAIVLKGFFLKCYVYGCFICISICVTHVYSAHRDQERTLNSLELEVRIVVCHCVVAGNKTWVPCKSSKTSTTKQSLQFLILIFEGKMT